MLVLTRKPNQAIMIGDDVRIVVVSVDRDQVRLGIEAPRTVSVHRAEIYEEIRAGRRSADGRGGQRRLRPASRSGRRVRSPRRPAARLDAVELACAIVGGCPFHPARRPGAMIPAGPAARMPPVEGSERSMSCVRYLHESAPRSGRPLRSPDAPLEPEDEAVHLSGAQRHLHHRSAEDRAEAARSLRVVKQMARDGQSHSLRRHQEAGAGRRSAKKPSAPARTSSTSAGWAARSRTSRRFKSGSRACANSRR